MRRSSQVWQSWPALLMVAISTNAAPEDHFFCGSSWTDVNSNCESRQQCPSGSDDDCTVEGHQCFAGTDCDVKLGHGSNGPPPSPTPPTPPSTPPGPTPTRAPIPSDHYFCGFGWNDAKDTCAVHCPGGTPNECPFGHLCYYNVPGCDANLNPPPPPPPTGPSPPPPTTLSYPSPDPTDHYFCGIGWQDAIDKCEVHCPSGSLTDCPPGHLCYFGTPCDARTMSPPPPTPGAPTSTVPPTGTPTKAPISFDDPSNMRFCGETWPLAQDNCSLETHCPSGNDNDCPGSQQCFEWITTCNVMSLPTFAPTEVPTESPTHSPTQKPSPKPSHSPLADDDVANTFFCGSDWNDAVTKCAHRCPGGADTECPDELTCYAFTSCTEVLTGTPTKAPTGTTDPPTKATRFPSKSPTVGTNLSPPSRFPTKTPTITLQPSRGPSKRPTAPPSRFPTAAPTQRPTTSYPTPAPTMGPCDGDPCPVSSYCRSPWGFCGPGSSYCNENAIWSASCGIPTEPPTRYPTKEPTTAAPTSWTIESTKTPTASPVSSPPPNAPPSPPANPADHVTAPSPEIALAVEQILDASKNGIDNALFLYRTSSQTWEPSTLYRYEGFLAGLRVMYQDGVSNNYFYLGNDYPGGHDYGLVNIAAFLAQSMTETIKYDACDEHSWDVVNGQYPLSNACGQMGESYEDYHCSAEESHMECSLDPTMKITAVTNSKWHGAPPPLKCAPMTEIPFTGFWDHATDCNQPSADPPEFCDAYEGQQAGREVNDGPFANRAGRMDVENCCWWGRGALQTRGICSFGTLNYFLGKRAADEGRPSRYPNVNFCTNPEAICASEEHKELKWIAGMFYWINEVQKYDEGGWSYLAKLHEFVDGGMMDHSFIDAVSGIVNRGCHNPPCNGNSAVLSAGLERRHNFVKVITEFAKALMTITASVAPTARVTQAPASPVSPTMWPTDPQSVAPTKSPADAPMRAPTDAPINAISDSPTKFLTTAPTKLSTVSPTGAPVSTELTCDELCVEPIDSEDCPDEKNLPDCLSVEIGDLCESDGECGTRDDLNNCATWDIYRRVETCQAVAPTESSASPTKGPSKQTTHMPSPVPTTSPAALSSSSTSPSSSLVDLAPGTPSFGDDGFDYETYLNGRNGVISLATWRWWWLDSFGLSLFLACLQV